MLASLVLQGWNPSRYGACTAVSRASSIAFAHPLASMRPQKHEVSTRRALTSWHVANMPHGRAAPGKLAASLRDLFARAVRRCPAAHLLHRLAAARGPQSARQRWSVWTQILEIYVCHPGGRQHCCSPELLLRSPQLAVCASSSAAWCQPQQQRSTVHSCFSYFWSGCALDSKVQAAGPRRSTP
jgi:hypothetical protein